MKYEVSFASQNDHRKIVELRKAEYASADGYSVDLETLNWSHVDEQSYVMVIKENDKILATMRGEVIKDLSVVEKKIECPWDFDLSLKLPTMLLSRAATDKSYRGKGLNLALRYFFIEFAKKNHLSTVMGTFVADSPREQSLRHMGYRFFENKKGWQQSTYKSFRPVQVVVLDLEEEDQQAMNYCKTVIPSLHSQFVFKDQEDRILRYVRSL